MTADGTGFTVMAMATATERAGCAARREGGWYTLRSGIHQVYKTAHGFLSGEYLLLENRQPVGYDSTMTGGGITIYHAEEAEVSRPAGPARISREL